MTPITPIKPCMCWPHPWEKDDAPSGRCRDCGGGWSKSRTAKVTAENLTDEQIRDMRSQTGWFGKSCEDAQRDFAVALSGPMYDANLRREARERIAAAINARREGSK